MRGWIACVLLVASPTLAAEPDIAEGQRVFNFFCATCHGEDGKSGGPTSEVLLITTPDLTQLSASNDGVYPVFRVVRQIDGRDPLLSHGGVMPWFGDYFDFPDASIKSETGQPIITAQPIADVAAWLETIQE